jgi:hypothetical protein
MMVVTLYALNVPEQHCKITTFHEPARRWNKKPSDPLFSELSLGFAPTAALRHREERSDPDI